MIFSFNETHVNKLQQLQV